MLDLCLTVLMGEPERLCVGDRTGLPGLCVFLGNTSIVLTWAGTGRVDISVQLLVGLIILLHYKCRPPLLNNIFKTATLLISEHITFSIFKGALMQAMAYAVLMEPPCRKRICTYYLAILNVCIVLFL